MSLKLKVCCIKSIQEAEMAIEYGTDAIGLVGPMPSGPGIIDDEKIFEIVQHVQGKVDTFLLSSETKAKKIIEHHKRTKTSTIQLVDHVNYDELKLIRSAIPKVRIVQVIHIANEDSVSEARQVSPYVDALLLDSGKPNAEHRTLGGTGLTHNWKISHEIVKQSSLPVYLAGGINQSNVQEAVNSVHPYGIDLCSGVRRNDNLQADLLESFVFQLKIA